MWTTQPTRRGRWRPGDRRPGAGIAPERCGAPGAGLWSVTAPRRSDFRWPQCRSRQMQAFRSRDLKGLVAWQTAYHPEGVGIDEGKTLRFIGKARDDTGGGMSLVEVDYDARGSVIGGFAGVPDRFGCALARAPSTMLRAERWPPRGGSFGIHSTALRMGSEAVP